MPSHHARIDAYVARAAGFAQPILVHLRALVHGACPRVEEIIKWRMPAFVQRGRILCRMAAFKQHALFGFRKHAQLVGAREADAGIGSFRTPTTLRDLPRKRELLALIRKAAVLARVQGTPPAAPRPVAERAVSAVPDDLAAALAGDAEATRTFDAFAPGHRRDDIEWIVEGKRADTRARRIVRTVQALADGSTRNWQYAAR